jgi:hypothetical protein
MTFYCMSEMESHYGSLFYIKNIIVDILCSAGHLKVNDNDQFVMMFEGINQRVKRVLKALVQICSIVVCSVICLV